MHTTIPLTTHMDEEMSDQIRRFIRNRAIIVDAHAFGSLRKDLIHNIGLDRTKGFLFRYGWNMGVKDARECKEKESYQTIEELIEYGPVMHSIKGFVKSKTLTLTIKRENQKMKFRMESAWEHSIEADEHITQIGINSSPVCYTLSGYASGFVSEVCDQMIIFKEICCRGAGASECMAIGKTKSEWGNEVKEELYYLKEPTILEELELTYEKLLQERNCLTATDDIYRKLTEEIVKGTSLAAIIQQVYLLSKFPVVVHNVHGHPIVFAGISTFSQELTPNILFQYINKGMSRQSVSQNIQLIKDQHKSFVLLTHPIYLQEKRMGYCSFLFKDYGESIQKLSKLMIEKVASVCSLCFFYEKTKLDSFGQMKSFFLQDILNGQFLSEDEIIAKAGLFQFDFKQPYYLGIIGYSYNMDDFHNELAFCREAMAAISHSFSKRNQPILMSQSDHHINLLVMDHYANYEEVYGFFEELIQSLHSRFPGAHFHIGVSKKATSILDAPNAYREALGAKRMVSQNKRIFFFENLGIAGTFINKNNENDVRAMAHSLLGNLEMGCAKNIDLIHTLYCFLLNGGNLEKTADELSLSISGLRYRVNKIEEMLHKDIRNPMVSCQLLMAIQALIILDDLHMGHPTV